MKPIVSLPAMALVALAGCGPAPQPNDTATARTDDPKVHAFAKNLLNDLLPRSIRERREYCGYILQDSDGKLSTTPTIAGDEASCYLGPPGPNAIAAYHTHGSYSYEYDSEVPSARDLKFNFALNMDGYIGTPGGRFWHIDTETRRAYLLCGPSCIYTDPNNASYAAGQVNQSYTLNQLYAR